jgi:hypothetical protein
MISILAGCESSPTNPADGKREQNLPGTRVAEESRGELVEKQRCSFTNPDTSVCGIKIRNAASAAIIGRSQADSLGQYHFYSKREAETLTLVQYPGDGNKQISVFKVGYSDKASYGYPQLPVDAFVTEKGIRLGMTKKQLIEKLGNCYAVLDSTNSSVALFYKIEKPRDSKTRLLAANDIPAYYASYQLCDDRIVKLEFGFEYP